MKNKRKLNIVGLFKTAGFIYRKNFGEIKFKDNATNQSFIIRSR